LTLDCLANCESELYSFGALSLLIRSISQLTDEELIQVRKLLSIPDNFELVLRKKGDFLVYKPNGEYYPTYAEQGLVIYDYLRSIGIILPFRGYSVEQILQMGWAKIKEG